MVYLCGRLKNKKMMMNLLNVVLTAPSQTSAVTLTPYSSLIIGAILGLALACSIFIWVFNRRAQEWAHYYREHNTQNNQEHDRTK